MTDWQTKRDTAEYFGVAATELPTEPSVTLQSGNATVDLDAAEFADAFVNAFWPAAPWSTWKSRITAVGVESVAAGAGGRKLDKLAKALRQFRSTMTTTMAEVTQGEAPWKPPTAKPTLTKPPVVKTASPKLKATVHAPVIERHDDDESLDQARADIVNFFRDEGN